MLRVTFKSLLAHKLRLLLTALAVILGVAFVSGTLILGDTMSSTFDKLFATAYSGTDVGVRGKSAFDINVTEGGDPAQTRKPVPAAVLETLRGVPGVREAEGDLAGFAQIVTPEGKVVETSGAPTIGGAWLGDTPLNPYRLTDGAPPAAAGEVAIDVTTAADNGLEVGDSVSVLTQSGEVDATVTGIVGFGDGGGSLAGATVTLFDPATAQQTMGTPGTFSEILAIGDGTVSDEVLRDRVAEVLPADFEALTGEQIAATESGNIKEALGFFSIFLLVFAVISIFVGSFIIFNTFSMLVAQRSRELALLRALGASRRQVNRAVVLEALVVGLIGSTLGLALGVLLSIGLQSLVGAVHRRPALRRSCPPAEHRAVGLPHRRRRHSGRRHRTGPPRHAHPPGRGSARRRCAAGVLAAPPCGSRDPGAGRRPGEHDRRPGRRRRDPLGRRWRTGLVPGRGDAEPVPQPPDGGRGGQRPPQVLGPDRATGPQNARRNPRRTAATASALMIGLALVAAGGVLASSITKSANDIIDKSIGADFIVTTKNFLPIPGSVADEVRAVEGVDAVTSFRAGQAEDR